MRSSPTALILTFILICGCARVRAADSTNIVEPPSESTGVAWPSLFVQSLGFLGVEHGFRWLTEEGTRHPHRSFFDGYIASLNGLHGWADGDPFYVSYVGHPMQGAVAGYLFAQNDRQYRTVEFGKNRQYWKSRLRAGAYSWAYSEQFELGPLSEASIGNTQAFYPQQGFVDQVVTPSIGLGWMIGEDAIDRYIIAPLEKRIHNRPVLVLIRGGLNPSRSMANLLAARVPWHRDTRAGFWKSPRPDARPAPETPAPLPVTPLEFLATTRAEKYVGAGARGACIGGGAAAAFRVATHWQIVADVSGCKLTHFGANLSGDSLTYMVGPRWTAAPLKKWQPYAQVLFGGRTLTHEQIDPALKAQVEAQAAREGRTLGFEDHHLYARQSEITGFGVSAGAGLDVKLSSALALRVADARYMRSWHSTFDGVNYGHALELTSGLVLRWGTW